MTGWIVAGIGLILLLACFCGLCLQKRRDNKAIAKAMDELRPHTQYRY